MVEPSVGTASPPGHVSAIFRYLMIPWIPPSRSFLAVFQSIQWSINYLFQVHQDCDVRVSGQFTSWTHLYLFQSWFYHDLCSLCRSSELVNRNPNSHVFPKHSKSWSYGPQNHEDANMRAAKIARTKSQSDKSVRANLVPRRFSVSAPHGVRGKDSTRTELRKFTRPEARRLGWNRWLQFFQ